LVRALELVEAFEALEQNSKGIATLLILITY
jgi:hypothetical protein